MMATRTAYGQLTPSPDASLVYSGSSWDPLNDLEVRDRYTRKIRCLGQTTSNTRCRWDTDDYTLRSSVPRIEDVLAQWSQLSPHDISEHDLWDLLDLGVCSNHGSREPEAKQKGFRDLQARLAVVQSRVSRPQRQLPPPDHQVDQMRNELYQRSMAIEQHESTIKNLNTELAEKVRQLDSHLWRIQTEETKTRLLDHQLQQLRIRNKELEDSNDTLSKRDMANHNVGATAVKDLKAARFAIKALEVSCKEKDDELHQTTRTYERLEARLKQQHTDTLARQQTSYNALSKTYWEQQTAHETLQKDHKIQLSLKNDLEEECKQLRAEVQERQQAITSAEASQLEEVRQDNERQQTEYESLKKEHQTQFSQYESLEKTCTALQLAAQTNENERLMLSTQMRELEHDQRSLRTTHEQLQDHLTRQKSLHAETTKTLSDKEAEYETLAAIYGAQMTICHDHTKAHEAIKVENESLSQKLRSISTSESTLAAKNKDLIQRLQTIMAERNSLAADSQNLTQRLQDTTTAMNTLTAEKDRMSNSLQNATTSKNKLVDANHDLEQTLRETATSRNILAVDVEDLTQKLQNLTTNSDMLVTEREDLTQRLRETTESRNTLVTEKEALARQVQVLTAEKPKKKGIRHLLCFG